MKNANKEKGQDMTTIDIKTNEFLFSFEHGKLNINAANIDAEGIQLLIKILNVHAEILEIVNEDNAEEKDSNK